MAILLGQGLGTCCAALFCVPGFVLVLVVVLGLRSLYRRLWPPVKDTLEGLWPL